MYFTELDERKEYVVHFTLQKGLLLHCLYLVVQLISTHFTELVYSVSM
jgi:hypothetical protein